MQGYQGALRRDRHQRRRRPEEAPPGAARPRGAQGDRPRDRQGDARRPRARGLGKPPRRISPLPRPELVAGAQPRIRSTSSTSTRRARSSTRPATRTPTATACARCPAAASRSTSATWALRRRDRRGDRRVHHGLAGRDRHRHRRMKVDDDSQLTDDHRQGRLRHVRLGLDAVRRPGPDALLLDLRPGRDDPEDPTDYYNDANCCDKEYDRLYKQQKVELDPEKRRRDRPRDAHRACRQAAVYNVLYVEPDTQAYVRTASPASCSSPPRPGRCSSPTPRRPTRGSSR